LSFTADLGEIRELISRLQHGAGRRAEPGSGYACCKDSECQQHRTQRIYDKWHWYQGKSKADRDNE
jgi:hypothetical protein